jgi:LuxR family transcriptional activator of bioluminescence operon
MTFPQYGYGGALGLTTFLSCAARLDDRLVEDSIAYMAQWQMQLNAWARAVMERKNAARSLSQREAECLLLVAEGKTSKEISETIGIARRTVEFHIQNAMHKLGGTSRSQAAAILTQLSLPQLSASSTPQTRGIRRAKRSE